MTSRILGIDPGDRRIGTALSDPMGWTAQPLRVLDASDPTGIILALADLCCEFEVTRVVIGDPRHMFGDESPQAVKAKQLAEKLNERTGIPVELWDERLTSAEAERHLRDAGLNWKKRKARKDIVAAQLILQSYLDAHQPDSATGPDD